MNLFRAIIQPVIVGVLYLLTIPKYTVVYLYGTQYNKMVCVEWLEPAQMAVIVN